MKKQYASYQETIDFLTQAVGEHPNLIRVHSIGETWEKRPIMMATISQDVAFADLKPAMLYTGSIHAREWIGNELAIGFIKYIIDNYQSNPKLLATLTRSTLYIVPCLNPDGFEYSRTHFSFWRKNRRNNGDGSYGVDLNRNFGVRFRKGKDPAANTYSGPSAFSEPETAAIRDFVDTHSNITVSLDYHSQGNVFFPAHKFNHESEIEGTDLNVLCANMNREIKKVTGRKYGIHRGKPPFNLIHGSGREYYYSKGILATVVEVGTRNIPDYMQNMSQSIDENIPAMLLAFNEVNNYSKSAPPRPENFTIEQINANDITLSWEYQSAHNVYFEIYRSKQTKASCSEENLVGITRDLTFNDGQLKSGQRYFYNLRAVEEITNTKSPFAPEVKLKTQLLPDEFSRSLFPAKKDVGYVGQFTLDKNRDHFGHNSMFIGVSKGRGISYGVIEFNLSSLPDHLMVKSAVFSLYPMNRVAAKIEKFGEWSIALIDGSKITDISDFTQIHNAESLHTLGHAVKSDRMTQGMWREWRLNGVEQELLREHIKQGKLLLRIQGPDALPMGQDSQMMQFDIGYGRFGGGIHYRPNIELIYTLPTEELTLRAAALNTIFTDQIKEGRLKSGFDACGDIVYGQMCFSLDHLPRPDKTVICEAYLHLHNKNSLNTNKDIRFTIELAELKDLDYASVKQRQKIEFIGYEVGNDVLKEKNNHHFIFDSYCRQELERLYSENKLCYFIIRATSVSDECHALVDWHGETDDLEAKLVIKYIERRKALPPSPTNLQTEIENGMVKLTWSQSDDEETVGCFVVRNRFHPPRSHLDGVKLYAGKDGYTYDNFGNANIPKYYSVFSYDDVPNYSAPASIAYMVNETISIDEDFDESMLSEYGMHEIQKDCES